MVKEMLLKIVNKHWLRNSGGNTIAQFANTCFVVVLGALGLQLIYQANVIALRVSPSAEHRHIE